MDNRAQCQIMLLSINSPADPGGGGDGNCEMDDKDDDLAAQLMQVR